MFDLIDQRITTELVVFDNRDFLALQKLHTGFFHRIEFEHRLAETTGEMESRPFIEYAFNPHGSPHQLGEILADRKAQTCSAELPSRRSIHLAKRLEKRIETLRSQRELRRKRRKGVPVPLIAIIGYTNAGKSTLFNALTSSEELSEDKLFATLEPSQGRFLLPPTEEEAQEGGYGTPVVFTDTVGFIRDLPEELKNAFRATLEELYESHILLHAVDASSPYAEEQVRSVEAVLKEMELEEAKRIIVWNKADLIDEDRREELLTVKEGVFVSALQREGFEVLTSSLKKLLP